MSVHPISETSGKDPSKFMIVPKMYGGDPRTEQKGNGSVLCLIKDISNEGLPKESTRNSLRDE